MTYNTKEVRQLSIKEILERITEYDIFRYYVGNSFKMGTIHSPFRSDKRPSFDIYPSNATVRKIMYKDHATGESGSCFDLVMRMYGLSFMQALALIDSDFNLGLNPNPKPIKKTMGYVGTVSGTDISKLTARANIRVKRRPWNSTTDKDYWAQYGITVKTLKKFGVSPVVAVKVNWNWFNYRQNEPVYCYYFGEYMYKIYRPLAAEHRWASNATSDVIQGWDQLPESGDYVVITKSMKDVMVYHQLGIPAIAPQGEAIIPSKEQIQELERRFGRIISNYDYDRRGKVSANKMRRLYGITPIMFDNNFKDKDASDFVKSNGLAALKQLIWNIQKNL